MANNWVTTPAWSRLLFPKGLVWEMKTANSNQIFLTFDDGPNPNVTPFVLEQLLKYQAKATFFCVGNNVEKFPVVYQSLIEAGMTIGNHTFNHLNGWKTPTQAYIDNFKRARKHIGSSLFRPPYGKIKREQAKVLSKEFPELKIVMWSILSRDFDKEITHEQCLQNVISNLKPGSIVVFHDSNKAFHHLCFVLPKVLEYCAKQKFVLSGLKYIN